MSRRAHLHDLTCHLRRYLRWQKAHGVSAFVPATAEERAGLEARKKAQQQRQIDALRGKVADEQPPKAEQQGRKEAPTSARESVDRVVESAEKRQAKSKSASKPAATTITEDAANDDVKATTPIWQKHDAIHELAQKRRAKANSAATSAAPSSRASEHPAQKGTPQTPTEKMAFLRDYLGDCVRCPLHKRRTNVVFGQGDPKARLMFVGSGPNEAEDEQGSPFVGASGKLLTKMIEGMGLTREDVFLTNVVKCHPPDDRGPTAEEVGECSPFLKKQIEVVEPDVIVAVGQFATETLLTDEESLDELRGRWHEYLGIDVMPTYHPDDLLGSKEEMDMKRKVWTDLKLVMAKLGLN